MSPGSITAKQPKPGGIAPFWGATSGQLIANATWWMQPIIMHYLVAASGASASSAGLMLSIEMGAMALASALAAHFYKGNKFREISLIAALVAVVASVVTLNVHSYGALLASRAVAGMGTGVVLMASNTVAAGFADPDKTFARLASLNLLFGAALLAGLPFVNMLFSTNNPYVMTCFATVILVLPLALLPRGHAVIVNGQADGYPVPVQLQPQHFRNVLLLSFATFIVGVASGTIWAFYAVIGATAGLSEAAVEAAISVAIITAFFATCVASLLGTRLGRILPIVIGLFLICAAIIALSTGPSVIVFRLATCGNIAAVYFLVPYIFGAASAQDPSGRGAAYAGSAFFFAGAISPFVGGILFETVGIQVVGVAIVVAAIIAGTIIVLVERSRPDKSEPVVSVALNTVQ